MNNLHRELAPVSGAAWASLVRPITRSCSSMVSVFQAGMSCRYFCTIT